MSTCTKRQICYSRGAKRRPCILLACLALALAPGARVEAQASDGDAYVFGDARSDVLMADLAGFGLAFSAVGLNFLGGLALGADGDFSLGERMAASSLTELSDISLVVAESPDALPLSLAGGLLLGGEFLAASAWGAPSRGQQWFYWAKTNLAMFRSYDAYASIRERSDAWGDRDFRRYGAWDLMKEPFNPEQYAEPLLWGAVGVTLATVATQWALTSDPAATSPLTTGEWYAGDRQAEPALYWLDHSVYFLSANTLGAMGEEGVYRGVLHEELSGVYGTGTAILVDSAAFAAMHLATDLARDMDWRQILVHVLGVVINNVLFDLAYERGGMRAAVATHAAANFAGNILTSFLYAGVPASRLGY